jgi:hypothetical protein
MTAWRARRRRTGPRRVSFDYASMPSSSTGGSVLRLDHDFEIDPCVENAGSHAHAHGLTFRCDLGYMHPCFCDFMSAAPD